VSSRDTNTLRRAKHMISGIESAEEMTGAVEGNVPLESMQSRSPPSPAYSLISENEDQEELQARLRRAMMEVMRDKVPDQGDSLSSQPDLALILRSLSNSASLPPAKVGTLQEQNQGQSKDRGEELHRLWHMRAQVSLRCH